MRQRVGRFGLSRVGIDILLFRRNAFFGSLGTCICAIGSIAEAAGWSDSG